MVVKALESDCGKRLDSFLHERLPYFSRSRLQSWIKEGHVLLQGQAARPAYLLRGTESVVVTPVALAPLKAEPEDLPLTVVYEDEDVIVIDKAAGMVVHAGAGHGSGTLVNALLHRFERLSSISGDLRPGIVHRLDRDTSGLLVVARHDRAHRDLAEQFQSRAVEKIYLALVHGKIRQNSGKVVSSIGRDPVRRVRMTTNTSSGRAAHTEYRLLERLDGFDLLEVHIKTGRTHQIRVHLSSIGHPIVCDRLYGAPAKVSDVPQLNRFFLHAHRLSFRSPSRGELITLESPLPSELSLFLDALRRRTARI